MSSTSGSTVLTCSSLIGIDWSKTDRKLVLTCPRQVEEWSKHIGRNGIALAGSGNHIDLLLLLRATGMELLLLLIATGVELLLMLRATSVKLLLLLVAD